MRAEPLTSEFWEPFGQRLTAGYGRDDHIPFQAVYVAPPEDHRKERFHSHQAAVIRGPKEFVPVPDLDAFVGSVKGACA